MLADKVVESVRADMPGDALLNQIDSPADLRRCRAASCPLADELREYRARHRQPDRRPPVGSNLGTVELTVALHYVFNTPARPLVWDVGHQTYPHKILTGRRERMGTLRSSAASPASRAATRASTTPSAPRTVDLDLGRAGHGAGAKLKGEDRKAVAIIGDGAMTAGMAFEALNNAGVSHGRPGYGDLLVILNDNDMSISPPVGALNKYLARLMSGKFYAAAREGAKKVLKAPPLFELAALRGARQGHGRAGHHLRGVRLQLRRPDRRPRPRRADPDAGEPARAARAAVPARGHQEGLRLQAGRGRPGQVPRPRQVRPGRRHPEAAIRPGKPTFTQVFGQWLCDMAAADERLVGITPAMREGSGMVEFHKRFPKRYHDVGIAEQHAVTFAAGLACEGLKPVVAIYSPSCSAATTS
jgi:1-deoxy-D-xylulose-5-phosphate synthase